MKVEHQADDWEMFLHLRNMWAMEGSGAYSDLGIVCPYCKQGAIMSGEYKEGNFISYVHFGKPQYTSGNDNYDAAGIHGIGTRGDVIVLPFCCEEEGHQWEVVLGAHKGSIRCKIILTDDGKEPPLHFDSPIEQAFWEAWTYDMGPLSVDDEWCLIPQYQIGKYRVDFAHERTHTVIELDGHATHSSPDAIAYDRKRQREIEEQGWHVIRFGGKEVYRDARAVAREAFRLIDLRWIETMKVKP